MATKIRQFQQIPLGQRFSGVNADKTPVGPRQGPARKRMAATNIMGVYDQGTPAEHEEGRIWYPSVHEAAQKAVRQHNLDSHLHASGIVAAVSPNMDFSENNIHAFAEMSKLMANPAHRAILERSTANYRPHPTRPGQSVQVRTAQCAQMLNTHYPSIARAPDVNIVKASRIWEGEDTDTVLNPVSSPKTNSFAHGINDPSRVLNPHTQRPLATIDGRAHDIAINTLVSWGNTQRGISRGYYKRGDDLTHYQHFAHAYQMAAQVASADLPYDMNATEMQAHTWVIGKRMELGMPGSAGKRGPNRKGQPYV